MKKLPMARARAKVMSGQYCFDWSRQSAHFILHTS